MRRILFAILFLISTNIYAQQLATHNQVFLNPYVYNPALVGINGYNEVYLTHRKQWVGIEGAPATSAISIHLPTSGKLAFGFNFNNDKRGLLSTTSTLFTVGYTAQLGEDHFLRGGLSAGVGMNGIQLDKVENLNDPALNNVSSNSFFADGNIGLNYQFKNLNLGVVLPRIFQRNVISTTSFNEIHIKRLDQYLLTASYKFNFSNGAVAFEPQVMYHLAEGFPSRYEALGVIYLRDVLWFGGSYRQYNGPAAFAGFKINKQIKVGYAYDMSPSQITGFGNSSHEVTLSLRFGANKKLSKKISSSATHQDVPANKKAAVNSNQNNEKTEKEDVLMEEELAKIPSISKPSAPVAENKENPLTEEESRINNLRTEEKIKAQKREHPLELEKGHYVVVNAFRVFDNVIQYHEELSDKYANCKFGYSSSSMFYYSYLLRTTDLNRARFERNKLRKMKGFENTWVLTIE